jgi:hypothetical protein
MKVTVTIHTQTERKRQQSRIKFRIDGRPILETKYTGNRIRTKLKLTDQTP